MPGGSQIQQDVSDAAMTAAIEANLNEFFASMRHWPGAEVHDEPELFCTVTDVPFSFLNLVQRARLAPSRVDSAIEAAIARGRARNVPIAWWNGPATRPADLGAHLVKHGFVAWAEPPGMAMDLACLAEDVAMPAGLRIERVGDLEQLHTWCHALVAGFELPDSFAEPFYGWFGALGLSAASPALHYLGWLEEKPVATSTLFLAGGVAGIYCVGTVPQARQRGIGTAVTYAALREAQSRGYRVSILQASEMGYGVYRKLGFSERFRFEEYGWRPGEPQA